MPFELQREARFNIENAWTLANAANLAYKTESQIGKALQGASWAMEKHRFFDHPAGTQAFVAARGEHLLLAFRGTEPGEIEDWMTDANARQVGDGDLAFHKGFHEALDTVWKRIEGYLRPQLADKTLWITGHSLGAALATLAAHRLCAAGHDPVFVYNFGSPRVGNPAFYQAYRPITYRFVNNNDIVPHIPFKTQPVGLRLYHYKHVNSMRYFDRHGNLGDGMSDWAVKKDMILGRWKDRGDLGPDAFKDHAMARYLENVRRARGGPSVQ